MPVRARARSDEAKAERRDAILAAARERLSAADPPDITMAEVANLVGVAKGTVYLYFGTKEELFLAVLEGLLEEWFDELDAELAGGAGRLPASALADLFTASLAERPGLRRLLGLLGSVLERNVEYERALRFKWRLVGRVTSTGSQLERRTVFLRPGDGARVLLHLYALVIGLQQQAEPAPVIRRVLDAPGMDALRVDFDRDFRAAAGALLTGLERTN
jgi:AcrR family transcriptional regulator